MKKEIFSCPCGINNIINLNYTYKYNINEEQSLSFGSARCKKCKKRIVGAFSNNKVICQYIANALPTNLFCDSGTEIFYTYTPISEDKEKIVEAVKKYALSSKVRIIVVDLEENRITDKNITFFPIDRSNFGDFYMTKYSSPIVDFFLCDLAKVCGPVISINYCYLYSPAVQMIGEDGFKIFKYWDDNSLISESDALSYYKEKDEKMLENYSKLYVGV